MPLFRIPPTAPPVMAPTQAPLPSPPSPSPPPPSILPPTTTTPTQSPISPSSGTKEASTPTADITTTTDPSTTITDTTTDANIATTTTTIVSSTNGTSTATTNADDTTATAIVISSSPVNQITKSFPIFNRSPGSTNIPRTPILLNKGITAKTAVTARKTAGTAPSPSPPLPAAAAETSLPSATALGKSRSSARRPTASDDGSSSSSSASRLRASTTAVAKSANLPKLRKRKRNGPDDEDDDDEIVTSDLIVDISTASTRAKTNPSLVVDLENATTNEVNGDPVHSASPPPPPPPLAATDTMPESSFPPPAAPIANNPGSEAQSPPQALPETVAPTPACTTTTPTATATQPLPDRSRVPSTPSANLTRQRLAVAAEKRANGNKPLPHEIITIDSDDDEVEIVPTPPAAPAPTNGTSIRLALVERNGKAALVSAEEAKSSPSVSYPPTSFTQRVKAISAQLKAAPKPTAEDKNKSPPRKAPARLRSLSSSIDGYAFIPRPPGYHSRSSLFGSDTTRQYSTTTTSKSKSQVEGSQLATPPGENSPGSVPADSIQDPDGSGSMTSDPSESIAKSKVGNSPDVAGARAKWALKMKMYEIQYARELRRRAQEKEMDLTYVDDAFMRNVDQSDKISKEVLEDMISKLELTVFVLYEEASQYIVSSEFYGLVPGVPMRGKIDNYFTKRDTMSLNERLRFLMGEVTVMSKRGRVTFEAWKAGGHEGLNGKIVLASSSLQDLVEIHKKVNAGIEAEALAAASIAEDGDDDDDMRDDVSYVPGSPAASDHMGNGGATQERVVAGSGLQQSMDELAVPIATNTTAPLSHQPLQTCTQPPLSPPRSPGQNGQLGTISTGGDIEMVDADTIVGPSIESGAAAAPENHSAGEGRRNSLIVKLAAPPTALRNLHEKAAPAITHAFLQASPSVAPQPKPVGSARSQIKKAVGKAPSYSDIINEMHHFGETRARQIEATSREKYDPYLIRIRNLDAAKEKIRAELKRVSEEGVKKSLEYDKKLSDLVMQANVVDDRSRARWRGRLNGFSPPEQDLQWEAYQEVVQEKADHETDLAAAREKLVRRGMSINDEKRRMVQMMEENSKWEKQISEMKEARKLEMLVLEQPLAMAAMGADVALANGMPHTDESGSSTRATSASIGATNPPNETTNGSNDATGSASASGTVTDLTADTDDAATVTGNERDSPLTPPIPAPQEQASPKNATKVDPKELGKALRDVSGGYAAILLASIRNAALLPDSDESPPVPRMGGAAGWYGVGGGAYGPPGEQGGARKKKKARVRKGW